MTFYDMIKKKLGENEGTEKIVAHIGINAEGLVRAFVGMDEKIFETVKEAYKSERGEKIVKEMVAYIIGGMDVMTIPNDGKTSLFDKMGTTLVELMAVNHELFEAPAEEVAVAEAQEENNE